MRSAKGSKGNKSRSSCIRSFRAAFASGVVIIFALSRRRNMFVASARASSGAHKEPPARTVSAQAPRGPLSTSAAMSTDESTTVLNADPRFYSRVSAWRKRESVSRAFSCAPAAATRRSTGGQPGARAQRDHEHDAHQDAGGCGRRGGCHAEPLGRVQVVADAVYPGERWRPHRQAASAAGVAGLQRR